MTVCFFGLDSSQAISNSHVSVCCHFKNKHSSSRPSVEPRLMGIPIFFGQIKMLTW